MRGKTWQYLSFSLSPFQLSLFTFFAATSLPFSSPPLDKGQKFALHAEFLYKKTKSSLQSLKKNQKKF